MIFSEIDHSDLANLIEVSRCQGSTLEILSDEKVKNSFMASYLPEDNVSSDIFKLNNSFY